METKELKDLEKRLERHEIVLRQHRDMVNKVIEHLNDLNDALEKLVYEDFEGFKKYVTKALSERRRHIDK